MYWLLCVLRVTTHADPHKWLKDNCAVDKTCWFWKGLCLLYTLGHFAWSLFKKKNKKTKTSASEQSAAAASNVDRNFVLKTSVELQLSEYFLLKSQTEP